MSTPGAPTANNNLGNLDISLNATYYAFDATGGFIMEQGFKTIETLSDSSFNKYDLTNAVQVAMDVRYFNSLLGLYKEANYPEAGHSAGSSYDRTLQSFTTSSEGVTTALDSITITSDNFKANLSSANQIISVGAYSSMYNNFENYVRTYFGYPGGFASLFNKASLFDLSANDFTNLYKLLVPVSGDTSETHDIGAGADEISGNFIKDLSGNITISNITKTLRYAVDTNVFGNRNSGTSLDPNENSLNYGVNDGFLAGDLIYVRTGTTITLDLDIQTELFWGGSNPYNNPNVSTSESINGFNTFSTSADSNITNRVVSGDYSSVSTVTRKNINRILKAPLLIRLANLTDIADLPAHADPNPDPNPV